MKFNKGFKISFFLVVLVVFGCFSSKKVTLVQREAVPSTVDVQVPTKVFLLDASILLFPNGFSVKNDIVMGLGQHYWLDRADVLTKQRVVPLDSVAAMAYYELETSVGTKVGAGLLGLYGLIITPLSIRCLLCPKCCFGSCPTVYTFDGEKTALEAELFSYSISRYLQEDDLDRLAQEIPEHGPYRIRVSNEALETHYINRLTLLAVEHPRHSRIFPTDEGGFVSTRQLQAPTEAFNSMGEDVLHLVESRDDSWYRSDTTMVDRLAGWVYSDWVDLKVKLPPNSKKIKLVLRLRNTLLSTILFYDVVLGSQGIGALEWIERLNTDPEYASQYSSIYNSYAGIKVKTWRNGTWVQQAAIGDIGPIAWKYTALEIPLQADREEELQVRLQFFPDNFMIDYVAFDVDGSVEDTVYVNEVLPAGIRDAAGEIRDDILP